MSEERTKQIENPQEFSQNVLQTLLKCVKLSTTLPNAGAEYQYYSTFKGFQLLIQRERNSILEIMKSLIPGQNIRSTFVKSDNEDKFDTLLDMNASMFENIGAQIDDATCSRKAPEELIVATKKMMPINTSWNQAPNKKLKTSHESYTLLSSKNIPRPQFSFIEKVDNSNSLFVPRIKEKPHSLKPLAIIIEKNEYDEEEFCHPYEFELGQFRPFEEQLQDSEVTEPKSITETPLIMVDTEKNLQDMIEELQSQSEIAIDIENHSFRSFQGFACLIQISSRLKDYIIDAIKLRSELHVLNEITTNPKIVKVLHGADFDVLWLQRDFGVYIVNLFDTGQAARVLNFPHLSLAYLMKHYCNLDVDKQFQLADWRIRPLPPPLVKYAREDTHYLLYIYDCIKNDLLEYGKSSRSLLLTTLEKSKELCLKKYKKLLFDNQKYLEIYRKSKRSFNDRQLLCVKEMYKWRDNLARIEDESYGYILPNHMLLRIAEILPKDPQGIMACCNPVPPILFQQLNELHRIIMKVKNSPVNQLDHSTSAVEVEEIPTTVIHNSLNGLHDFRDEEKVTNFQYPDGSLNSCVYQASIAVPVKKKMSLPLIKLQKKSLNKDNYSETAKSVANSIEEENKTPFERYLLTFEFNNRNKVNEPEVTVAPPKETLDKSFIEIMDSSLDVSQNSLLDSSSNQVGECSSKSLNTSRSTENTTVDSDTEEQPSEAFTRKKKKRKGGRGTADIQFENSKKAKVNAQQIKPFDYKEASIHKLISDIKASSKPFNPNENTERQQKFSKKFKKRKKTGKQFMGHSSESRKSWPKN